MRAVVTRRSRVRMLGPAFVAAGALALAAPLPLVADRPVAAPDAIVVLASHEWERLPAAADAARQHPSAQVVLTVSRQFSDLSCHLCGERPRWLNHLGVAGGRIVEVTLSEPEGTWGEALAVAMEARRRGWRRVQLVTSPYHTRRALWTFRRAVRLVGVPLEVGVASAAAHSALRPWRWWAAPQDRWYVAYEWAASVSYAARGRLSAIP